MARPGNNWKKLPDSNPQLISDMTLVLLKILQGLANMAESEGGVSESELHSLVQSPSDPIR